MQAEKDLISFETLVERGYSEGINSLNNYNYLKTYYYIQHNVNAFLK